MFLPPSCFGGKDDFVKTGNKVNIHTPAGLDSFVDYVSEGAPVIIADMGVGAGQVTADSLEKIGAIHEVAEVNRAETVARFFMDFKAKKLNPLDTLLADISAQRVSLLKEPVRAEYFASFSETQITKISIKKAE